MDRVTTLNAHQQAIHDMLAGFYSRNGGSASSEIPSRVLDTLEVLSDAIFSTERRFYADDASFRKDWAPQFKTDADFTKAHGTRAAFLEKYLRC